MEYKFKIFYFIFAAPCRCSHIEEDPRAARCRSV
jgi:hypothetical protein